MVKVEDILAAHYDCHRGKTSSPDAIRFEMNLFENIADLTNAINARTYEPLPSITFVVSRPVYREVFAANYRDRVIHHYIALRLEPLFESVFSDRTYNCRVGKGQLYGIKQLAADIKKESENYTKPCWYLKCDMKGFFMSIPRKELADKIDAFIVENYHDEDVEDLRYLSRATIMNDPTKHCIYRSSKEEMAKVPPNKTLRGANQGCGLPIGNLTSQHDANFWLNDFDWMLESTLHIFSHGRYVDDFFMIHQDKQVLLNAIPVIRFYLAQKGIILHPRKIELQSIYKGITFTGMVVKRSRIYVSNRMVANFQNLIHHMNTLPDNYTIEQLEHYVSSINSYLGLMQHCNSYTIRKRNLQAIGSRFFKELYIKGRYECVCIKRKYRRAYQVSRYIRTHKDYSHLLDHYYE
jgi:RNA-directed DNA polymerase